MKVKELINILERLNQNQEIKYEGFKYTPDYDVETINEVKTKEKTYYVII